MKSISSIQIGRKTIVKLCTKIGYSGTCQALRDSNADLSHTTIGTNSVKSMKVESTIEQMMNIEVGRTVPAFRNELYISLLAVTYEGNPLGNMVVANISARGYGIQRIDH